MRSSVTETVLALSLVFRTGNITTRATHAATELGALLLQLSPWSAISQATAEQEQLLQRLPAVLAPASGCTPPRVPEGAVTVQRRASSIGVIVVAGQKIALGRVRARRVVTVHVATDTITIGLGCEDTRTARRTT
jgi:hypothetical protein